MTFAEKILQPQYEPVILLDLGTEHFRKGGTRNYFNDVFYDPRIQSIPQIAKSKSDLSSSQVKFEGGTITLKNHDGCFDSLAAKYAGLSVVLYLGFEDIDFSEFQIVFRGYVEQVSVINEFLTLKTRDERKKIAKKIPETVFDIVTYPYIDPSNVNKVIPMTYGTLKKIPVVCTNEQEPEATTFTFKLADTRYHSIKAITTVYVDGVVKVPLSKDLINSIFVLSSATFTSGQEVTADIQGYESGGILISNGLDILKDILVNNYGYTWDDTNFDRFHWYSTRALTVQLFLSEPQDFFTAIKDVCLSSLINLVKKDDGRWIGKIFYDGANSDQVIDFVDVINKPAIDFDVDKSITSVLVNYDKDYQANKYTTYIDASRESALSAELDGLLKRESYETNHTLAADVAVFTSKVLDIYGTKYKTFEIETSFSTIQREVGDIIDVELKRPQSPEFGIWRCEIIKPKKILDTGKCLLTCRAFALKTWNIYDQGNYWGGGYWGDGRYNTEKMKNGDCENASSPSLDGSGIIYGPWDGTWARSAAQKKYGTYSWLLTNTHVSNDAYIGLNSTPDTSNMRGLIAGKMYSLDLWAYTTSGVASRSKISIGQYYSGAWHATDIPCTSSSSWHQLIASITINAGATGIYFNIVTLGAAGIGTLFYIDQVSVKITNGTDIDGDKYWGKSYYRLDKTREQNVAV